MISKESAKLIREQLKLTQKDLAKLIEGSQVTVCRYETGSEPVSYKYIKRIAEKSGFDIVIRVTASGDCEAWIPSI